MNNNRNDFVFDLMNLFSFVIGVENLQKNDEQIKELENHLSKQDKQYEEIIRLLKEKKDEKPRININSFKKGGK